MLIEEIKEINGYQSGSQKGNSIKPIHGPPPGCG
jgi:hypothetical protein